jgi:hypothetical protein
MCRRCGERDRRGSADRRRARKRWLLEEFGDGTRVECFWGCGTALTFATLQQDRIVPGGPYRRDNLVPSCADCNIKRSAATIPDGCHYGPVGNLTTDRAGRYPDEPPLAAPDRDRAIDHAATSAAPLTPIPQPRSGSAVPSRPGGAAERTTAEEGSAMHFPRPHRSVHRAARPPDHRRQPAAISGVALAEHTRDTHQDAAVDVEPDLVVIDTANVDEIRARHPWLFNDPFDTGDAAEDRGLHRVDTELAAAEQALDDSDDADTGSPGRIIDAPVQADIDNRDTELGR